MIEMKLYTGGGASFSPVYRDGSIESDYVRLVADDVHAITNGEDVTTVIDIKKTEKFNWTDCDLPPIPPDPEPEPTSDEILDILMGVN